MPVRVFICKHCEHSWEELVSMNGFSQGKPDGCEGCGKVLEGKDDIKQGFTTPASIKKTEYEMRSVGSNDENRKELKRIDPMGTKYSTEHVIGYKPKEKSRIKSEELPEGFNSYGEYEKNVSELSKREYDKKEDDTKNKEALKKAMGKGSTVIFQDKSKKVVSK